MGSRTLWGFLLFGNTFIKQSQIYVQKYVSDSYGSQVYSKDNGKTIHSKRKWKSVVQKVKQEVVPFVRKSGLFEKTYSTYALDFKVSTKVTIKY